MTNTDAVDRGVARLSGLLPLPARVDGLDPDTAAIHREIIRTYLRTGLPPAPERLRERLPGMDVVAGLARLDDLDLVVTAGDRIVGAYPFRSEDSGYEVAVGGVTTGAMCSLDALAIGAVSGSDAAIRSRCPATGRRIEIEMAGGDVVAADPPEVVVGIHWQDPGSCAAGTLCREMVFLADPAARWSEGGDVDRYPLAEAVEFARRFFRPVISPALDVR